MNTYRYILLLNKIKTVIIEIKEGKLSKYAD